MGQESFDVVRFNLGTLLEGQMMTAKLKNAYNSLIIDPRGLGCAGLAKYLKNMESNGLHVLRKMESQSFFSESSVCVRVMKRRGPCTLWLIKKGVPLYENWVQVILFLP